MDNPAIDTDKIGNQLVSIMTQALSENKLTPEDASEISDLLLKNVETLLTQQQVIDLLTQLSSKWPVFDGTLTLEKGKVSEQEEQIKAQKVTSLIKENKIDEALKVAEEATAGGEEGVIHGTTGSQ